MTAVGNTCACAQPAVAAAPVTFMGPPAPPQYAAAPPEPLPLPGAIVPNQTSAGVDAIGSTLPTAEPAKPGTGAWLAAWPTALARLQQLGVPSIMIDSLGRQPMNEPELARAVADIERTLSGQQVTGNRGSRSGQQSKVLIPLDGTSAAPGQRSAERAPGTPRRGQQPPAPKGADPQAAAVAKAKQVLAKHAESGMPQELLDVIAQNATSPEGLDATLTQMEGRMDKVRKDGWVAKFEKAGVGEAELWQLVLGGNPEEQTILGPMPKDSDLDMALVMAQRGKAGMGRQALEAAVSLIPGVQAAEYVAGKNVISGSEIRRYDGMNQLLAGVSAAALGVVALGKFHSAKALLSGLKSAREGFTGLTGVTGRQLVAGSQGAKLAEMSAAGKLTFGKTFFNKSLSAEVRGMGHIEAAAKARLGVGAKMDVIGRTISDDVLGQVADGSLRAGTGALSSGTSVSGGMGRLPGVVQTHPSAEIKDGVVVFNKKLRISNGTTQLASIVKASGDQMAAGKGSLADRLPALAAQMDQFSSAQRDAAGEVTAAMALRRTGRAGRDGGPAKDLNKLLDQSPSSASLSWYHDALAATPAR